MSDESALPIEPGSELDKANTVFTEATLYVGAGQSDESFWAFKLLDPANPAHMLAVGARIYFLKCGINNPAELVSEQHGQWFGRPAGSSSPT